jgi:hypothetical protein
VRTEPHSSEAIEAARIDVVRLSLVPLPLLGGERINLRATYEPFRRPDPYAPVCRKLTAKLRACFEFDPIARGAFRG